jgi:phosphoglycolate phosphatase
MTIKGILFDKDGTLLDFFATWIPVVRWAAEAAAEGDLALAERMLLAGGYDLARDEIRPGSLLAAGNTLEIAACWAEFLPGRSVAALVAETDRIFEEGGSLHATAITPLAPLFSSLKARGLKLGVATSDGRRAAEATLEGFGVLELLNFIAGYDSGHGIKPNPGMVLAFCDHVGLVPGEVAVVGDNLHDLEMGLRAEAGLLIGVLSGTSGRRELAPAADHLLASVADLEALLDRLG